jgi:hypothetical protein
MPDVISTSEILKVSDELGLVFGFAMVSKDRQEDGTFTEHWDLQEHHIPEDVVVKSATDFMQSEREAHDMHAGPDSKHGQVLFAFPLTEDIAKALDIQTPRTGLLIGMKPSAAVLAKFKSGEYTGFSIGGSGHLVDAA